MRRPTARQRFLKKLIVWVYKGWPRKQKGKPTQRFQWWFQHQNCECSIVRLSVRLCLALTLGPAPKLQLRNETHETYMAMSRPTRDPPRSDNAPIANDQRPTPDETTPNCTTVQAFNNAQPSPSHVWTNTPKRKRSPSLESDHGYGFVQQSEEGHKKSFASSAT